MADSSFAALELLNAALELPVPIHLVTRLRLDAALYQLAPVRLPKQMGRPRKVGKRLPTLKTVLGDATTVWQSVTIERWYGGRDYEIELTSQTAVWYHTGLPPVPLRWVLVKDPQGKFEPQAFLCTDLNATPDQILHWFRQRWQLRSHVRGRPRSFRCGNATAVVELGNSQNYSSFTSTTVVDWLG